MVKKKNKKVTTSKRLPAKSTSMKVHIMTISIFAAFVLMIGLVIHGYTSIEKYQVLGASTMLARGGDGMRGDDTNGNDSSNGSFGGSNPGSSTNTVPPSESEVNSDSPKAEDPRTEQKIGSPVMGAAVGNDTRGQCTGPDGKKFESRFRDCQEFNAAWKKPLEFKPVANDLPPRRPEINGSRLRPEDSSKSANIEKGNRLMPPTQASDSGQRPFIIMPEQAMQNLIKAKIVNRLNKQKANDDASNSASANPLTHIATVNGVQVYKINGISEKKIFGFIPVEIEKEVNVSTETGNAVSINQSFFSKFLDTISF